MSDEREMAEADAANGEGTPGDESEQDSRAANDAEARYGEDESPA